MKLTRGALRATIVAALVALVGVGLGYGAVVAEDSGSTESDEDMMRQYAKDYSAWFETDFVKSLDPYKIPSILQESEANSPAWKFEKAVDWSHVVVRGTVKRLEFVPGATLTEFAVQKVAKGPVKESSPGSIFIMQPAKLEGHQTGHPKLIEEDGNPLLRPGEEAMLLLVELPPIAEGDPLRDDLLNSTSYVGRKYGFDTPLYEVITYNGQYKVKDGKLQALPKNKTREPHGASPDVIMSKAAARAAVHPEGGPPGIPVNE